MDVGDVSAFVEVLVGFVVDVLVACGVSVVTKTGKAVGESNKGVCVAFGVAVIVLAGKVGGSVA